MARESFVQLLRKAARWDVPPPVAEARVARANARLGDIAVLPAGAREAALLERFRASGDPRLTPGLAAAVAELSQGATINNLGDLTALEPVDPQVLVAIAEALAAIEADPPPTEVDEEVAFVPQAPEPDVIEAERTLHVVQFLVLDEPDKAHARQRLRDLGGQVQDLASMQLVAAGLIALLDEDSAFDPLRQKASGSALLGVGEPAWVEVPAGPGLVGSLPTEQGGEPDEHPQTEPPVAAYRILATPMTDGLRRVLARRAFPEDAPDFRLPATIGWNEAKALLAGWSRLTGGASVRFPSEAEWEKACRAGTRSAWWTGDDPAAVTAVAWLNAEGPAPVTERPPNPLGLHDVHGGVWEWCRDEYAPYGQPTAGDGRRVARGGSWADVAAEARSANRQPFPPDAELPVVGLRPVLDPSGGGEPVPLEPPSLTPPTPIPTGPVPGGGGPPPPPGGGGPGEPPLGGDPALRDGPVDGMPGRVQTGLGLIPNDGPVGDGGAGEGDCCCVCCDEVRTVQPGGDLPEGQNSPEDEAVIDDVVAGAQKAVDDGNKAQAEQIDKGIGQVDEVKAAVEAEEAKRAKDPERRRVEAERERIKTMGDEIDAEQAQLDEDRREVQRDKDRIQDLQDQERAAHARGDAALEGQLRATRETLQRKVSGAEQGVRDRTQRLDEMRDARAQRVERLERAQDRGYGLTPEERDARTAKRNLDRAIGDQARAGEMLDLLREREAAQGGLSAADRQLKQNLERASADLDRRIGGSLGEARAASRAAAGALQAADDNVKTLRNELAGARTSQARAEIEARIAEAEQEVTRRSDEARRTHDALSAATRDYQRDTLRGKLDEAQIKGAYGDAGLTDWRDKVRQGGLDANAGRVEAARSRLALQGYSNPELADLGRDAGRARFALGELKAQIGKPGRAPQFPDAWGAQMAAARDRVESLQGRIEAASRALDAGRGRRADLQGRIAAARRELARLGSDEFAVPGGADRDRIVELQAEARRLRPQLRDSQSVVDARRRELADAGGALPDAQRALYKASPLGAVGSAQDRVMAWNREIAPWVRPDGALNREALRATAGAQLRQLQQFSNHGRRADDLQRTLNSAGAPPRERIEPPLRDAERGRDQAKDRLTEAGWTSREGGVAPPSTILGKGFSAAFAPSQVRARTQRLQTARRTYQTPTATVAAARIGQAALNWARRVGGGLFGGVVAEHREGETRAADAKAAKAAPDAAALIADFVARTTRAAEQDALKAALDRLQGELTPAALRQLLTDARILIGGGPVSAFTALEAANRLLAESSRQLQGLDGAAHAAVLRMDSLDALADALPPAATGEAPRRAVDAAWSAAAAEAEARLREQQRQAEARGQSGRARMLGAWADSLRIVREGQAGTLDPAAAREAAGRIRADLDLEAQIVRGAAVAASDRAGSGDAATRTAAETEARELRDWAASLANAQTHFVSGIVSALARRVETGGGAPAFEAYRAASAELAELVGRERQRYEAAAAAAPQGAEREKARTEARRLSFQEAGLLLEAGEYARALQILEGFRSDNTTRAQLAQLALQGYARAAQDLSTQAPDAASEADWFAVQHGFLALAETHGEAAQTRAAASAARASLAVRARDIPAALALLDRALTALPGDPQLLASRLGLILAGPHGDPPRPLDAAARAQVWETLAQAGGAAGAELDAGALAALLHSLPDAELDALAAEVTASGLSDLRKQAWLLRLETVLLYRDLDNGLAPAQARDRATAIRGRIDAAGLPPEDARAADAALTTDLGRFLTFRQIKDRFTSQPDSLDAPSLSALGMQALERGEVRLGLRALELFSRADAASQTGRLQLLCAAGQRLAQLDPAQLAPDEAQALQTGPAALARLGEGVFLSGREAATSRMTELSMQRGELQSREAETPWLIKAGGWLLEQPFQLAGTAATVANTETKLRAAEEARIAVIAAHEAGYRDTLARLTQLYVQLQLQGSSSAGDMLYARIADAEDQLEDAERSLEGLKPQLGAPLASSRAQYFDALTRTRAAQAMVDALRMRAAWRRLANAGEPSRPPDRSGEGEVRALNDLIYGGEGVGGGLYQELVSLRTHPAPDESVRRRLAEVEIRIADAQARIERWVFEGPIAEPRTGRAAGAPYRQAIYADLFQRREQRAVSLADRAPTAAARQAWRAHATQIHEFLTYDRTLQAYGRLLQVADQDPRTQAKVFAEGLILAGRRLIDESRSRVDSYFFPQSRWDRSAVQMIDAFYTDWLARRFGAPRSDAELRGSDSFEASLWRIDQLETELTQVQSALLKVVSGQPIAPNSEDRRILKTLGILQETSTGDELVVPADLSREDFRKRVAVPETTGWHEATSVRFLAEVGVTTALGAFLGIGISALAARTAGLLARAGLGGRLLTGLARSPLALRMLGVTREAAALTVAGRASRAFMEGFAAPQPGAVPPQTSLLQEFEHNLITFAVLDALGPLIRLGRTDERLTRALENLQSYLASGRALPVLGAPAVTGGARVVEIGQNVFAWLATGLISTGIETSLSGEAPTASSLFRNLVEIPGMAEISHRFAGGIVYPRSTAGASILRGTAPLRPAQVDPARAAGARARFAPAVGHVLQSGDLTARVWGERVALETLLRAAGVQLVAQPGDGPCAFERTPSGADRIVIREDTTRLQLLEEFAKARAAESLGLGTRDPFTSEREAEHEREGYRILQEEYLPLDSPPPLARYAQRRRFLWERRLANLRAGLSPNLVLHEAGDGIRVFSGSPERTPHFRNLALQRALEAFRAGDQEALADVLRKAPELGLRQLDDLGAWGGEIFRQRAALESELAATQLREAQGDADAAAQAAGLMERIGGMELKLAQGMLLVTGVLEARTRQLLGEPLRLPLNVDRLKGDYAPALRERLARLSRNPKTASKAETLDLLAWARAEGIVDVGVIRFDRVAPDSDLGRALVEETHLKSHLRWRLEVALELPEADLATVGIDASAYALIREGVIGRLLGDTHAHLEGSAGDAYFLTGAGSGPVRDLVLALTDPTARAPAEPDKRGAALAAALGRKAMRAALDKMASLRPQDMAAMGGNAVLVDVVGPNGRGFRTLLESASQLRSALQARDAAPTDPLGQAFSQVLVAVQLSDFLQGLALGVPPELRLSGPGRPRTLAHDRFFSAYAVLKTLVEVAAGRLNGRSMHRVLGSRTSEAALGYSQVHFAARGLEATLATLRGFSAAREGNASRFLSASLSKNAAAQNLSTGAIRRELRQRFKQARFTLDGRTLTGAEAVLGKAQADIAAGQAPDPLAFVALPRWLRADSVSEAFTNIDVEAFAAGVADLRARATAAGLGPLPTPETLLREGAAGLGPARFDDMNLGGLVSAVFDPLLRGLDRLVGLDSSGEESRGRGPELMWSLYAQRAVENARSLNATLSRLDPTLASAVRQKAVDLLYREGGPPRDVLEAWFDGLAAPHTPAGLSETWGAAQAAYLDLLIRAELADASRIGALRAALAPGGLLEAVEFLPGLRLADLAQLSRSVVDALRALGVTVPRQLGATAHAGEQLLGGMRPRQLLADVVSALRIGVDRIGHGVILGMTAADLVRMGLLGEAEAAGFDAERKAVLEELKRRGIVVELNLSSNLRISGLTLEQHPARILVREGVRFSINTDDEAVLATSIEREIRLFTGLPGVSFEKVLEGMLTAFDSRLGGHPLADPDRLRAAWRAALDRVWPPSEVRARAVARLAERFLGAAPAREPGDSAVAWSGRVLDMTLAKIFGATP